MKEICEFPGCDRFVGVIRPQRSGDVLRLCGQPHVFGPPSPADPFPPSSPEGEKR